MRNLDSPWHLAVGVQATVPHRLRSGHVVQLWRPGPEPHLQSWYQPAAILCHQVRVEDASEPIDLDDLLFLGRLDEPGGRSLFAYRHRHLGGTVLVDAEGTPYEPLDDPRRRTGHRFGPIGTRRVIDVLRAGSTMPPVPQPGHDEHPGAVVLPFRRR